MDSSRVVPEVAKLGIPELWVFFPPSLEGEGRSIDVDIERKKI
jgi:hypothetical protein